MSHTQNKGEKTPGPDISSLTHSVPASIRNSNMSKFDKKPHQNPVTYEHIRPLRVLFVFRILNHWLKIPQLETFQLRASLSEIIILIDEDSALGAEVTLLN